MGQARRAGESAGCDDMLLANDTTLLALCSARMAGTASKSWSGELLTGTTLNNDAPQQPIGAAHLNSGIFWMAARAKSCSRSSPGFTPMLAYAHTCTGQGARAL